MMEYPIVPADPVFENKTTNNLRIHRTPHNTLRIPWYLLLNPVKLLIIFARCDDIFTPKALTSASVWSSSSSTPSNSSKRSSYRSRSSNFNHSPTSRCFPWWLRGGGAGLVSLSVWHRRFVWGWSLDLMDTREPKRLQAMSVIKRKE